MTVELTTGTVSPPLRGYAFPAKVTAELRALEPLIADGSCDGR